MEEENFIGIKDYENLYEVSDLGNVYSLNYNRTGKRKVMSGTITKAGYRAVKLSNGSGYKTFTVHQLVAVAFLGHIPCGMEVVINHKDFDKLNNRKTNLEITTQRDNANKKHLKSSSEYVGVSWHKQRRKWQSRILIKGRDKHLGFFDNEFEASGYYDNAVISIKNNTEIVVKEKDRVSKYKGVAWHKVNNKWTSQIRLNGKQKYLGSFSNEYDAHIAYENALKILV